MNPTVPRIGILTKMQQIKARLEGDWFIHKDKQRWYERQQQNLELNWKRKKGESGIQYGCMGSHRVGKLYIKSKKNEVRWIHSLPAVDQVEAKKITDKAKPIETDVIAIRRIPQEYSLQGETIAVQLHLFYVDLIDEFIKYFSHIPFSFDLYISCQENADAVYIAKRFAILEHAREIIVRPTPNRGRDIAPVYVLFAKELAEHDYFLHVHSKKSFHLQRGQSEWRTKELDGICGSEEQIRKIFALFQNPTPIGLCYTDTYGDLDINAHSWTMNKENGKKLSKRLDYEYEDVLFNYPVGSFYWAKVDAIRPMLEANFRFEEFPEENGQLDGTLAHSLERAIAFVIKHRGYLPAIVDEDEGIVRIGISRKLYRDYFQLTVKTFEEKLMKHPAVSFAIFDTLVMWKDHTPETMEEAYEQAIPRFDMQKIYEELQKRKKDIYLVSDTSLPREAVRKILKKCGYSGYKKLYLSKEANKGKIDGTMWDELRAKWIKEGIVHVGDDLCADNFVCISKEISSLEVLSPYQMYRISMLGQESLKLCEQTKDEVWTICRRAFNSPFALADGGALKDKAMENKLLGEIRSLHGEDDR